MPRYSQANRPLAVRTPLGEDVLLLTGVRGYEAISQLFSFQLDLLAELESEVFFDRIVGESVTVEMLLANGEKRYFSGLVKRFSEGDRGEIFVHFRAELVPKLWQLTKKVRSRIFQRLSVPDILHEVLSGLDVSYEISGSYYPRDYCVQYGESDFDFVSRLMEEEGIYYFFKHSDAGHQMVVKDASNRHPTVPGTSRVRYENVSGGVQETRITAWQKSQQLRAGAYTLWDHCFELPDDHLQATENTAYSVTAGKVTHKLSIGGNDQLELYEYPGGYAQRFDGVDSHGVARPQGLQNIIEDRQRTVRVRMEQEEALSLEITGASNCGQFTVGRKFGLERHFDADGSYLLTRVEHDARLEGSYSSGQDLPFSYGNRFTCIPVALPYRPQRVTRKPVIAGIQTATVVGPPGEEIFCDKYGRVKVQFHWDREGKMDGDSSCWLRVAQVWAGNGWGAFFWPRVGHEVVVAFEEGDPNQPMIIGSVYNAENLPPYELPAKDNLTGFKSASVRGRARENFNGIVFDDAKGHEHLAIHSERNMSLNAEFDKIFHGGRHKGERVAVANMFTVGHFPSTGGSGGGPDFALGALRTLTGGGSGGEDIGKPLGIPRAQGLVGLNSTLVYGENIQTAVGINHQLAVGSNFQICVNPAGLLAGSPEMPGLPFFAQTLGGGLGGNMQFTIGTNAQVTYGRAFEINVGGPKVELKGGTPQEDAVSYGICAIIGTIVLIYVVAYGLLDDDQARADLTIALQICLDVQFGILMWLETIKQQTGPDYQPQEAIRKALFKHEHVQWSPPQPMVHAPTIDAAGNVHLVVDPDTTPTPEGWEVIGAGAAVLGAMVAPLVVAAENERSTDDDKATRNTK